MVDETIAARLRAARQRAGWRGPTEAAIRFGWTAPTYLAHENGSRGLSVAAAVRYSRAFHVSLDWLLAGEKRRSRPIGDDRTPGERLREARLAAGYATAKAAATARGWSTTTYCQHESGTRRLTWDRATIYGTAFGEAPEWLIGGAPATLSESQRRALAALDRYPEADREAVIRMLEGGAASPSADEA